MAVKRVTVFILTTVHVYSHGSNQTNHNNQWHNEIVYDPEPLILKRGRQVKNYIVNTHESLNLYLVYLEDTTL